jgi:predicted  nucleic acid-binding Zn-ribbon protein
LDEVLCCVWILNCFFSSVFECWFWLGCEYLAKSEVCGDKLLDQKDYKEEGWRQKVRICQGVFSVDPSNLLDSVIRSSPDGTLEKVWFSKNFEFAPVEKLNSILATISTSGWTAVLPGSYVMKARNNSLDQESAQWQKVKSGRSALLPLYSINRSWKAIYSREAKNYWLFNMGKEKLGIWDCPTSYLKPVGAGEEFSISEVDRECARVPVNAQNVPLFLSLLERLQQNYASKINMDRLLELEGRVTQTNESIERVKTEIDPLQKQSQALSEKLSQNSYFKAESDYKKWSDGLAAANSEISVIEKKIRDWLNEAPDRLTRRGNRYKQITISAIVVAIGLGAIAMNPLGWVLIIGGGIALFNNSYDQIEINALRAEVKAMSACASDLKKCPTIGEELGRDIKKWQNDQALVKQYEQAMLKIEEYRTTDEYLRAKLEAANDEQTLNSLNDQIAQKNKEIEGYNALIANLRKEIQEIRDEIPKLTKKIAATAAIGIAVEELAKDPKLRIVRRLMGDWERYQIILKDLSTTY